MPLPDEEVVRRARVPPVELERRGAARPAAPPGRPLDHEGRRDDAPSRGTPRLAPFARGAIRALEPAVAAARSIGGRLQRRERDLAALLAEGTRLEAAGDGLAAFRVYARALLAAPLDASPVRGLERVAGRHGCRLALARLYEKVLERVPDHPSAATIARRAAELRALAETAAVATAAAADDRSPAGGAAPVCVDDDRAAPSGAPARDPGAADASPSTDGGARRLDRGAGAPRARADDRPRVDDGCDPSIGARRVALGRSQPGAVPAGARLLAWAIDAAVVALVPAFALLVGLAGVDDPGLGALDRLLELLFRGGAPIVAAFVLALVTAFVYFTLSTAMDGRTLGDRVAGLRAVDASHGGPPDLAKAALRSVFAIAGTLAFLAGPLWAFVDPAGRALHDRVAGTRTLRC